MSRRNPLRGKERALHLDIEEANRRDADAGDPPARQPDSHRGQPWWTPTSDDRDET